VDYLASANSLQVTKLDKRPASSPKVSTDSLNYSRFLESLTEDYFDRRMDAQVAVLDARKDANRALLQDAATERHERLKAAVKS
jgi:hypothetical protein